MDIFSDGFFIFVLVGFLGQLVDGALGMAYGTLSMTVLLSTGMPPAIASAGVHTAQFFTTGVSGFSHAAFHNVNWRLCFLLATAGMTGGIFGALFLVHIEGDMIRPWIAAYLFVLGLIILHRVWKGRFSKRKKSGRVRKKLQGLSWRLKEIALGLTGGGLDAIGGGGWGPIVTSTLLAAGEEPRHTVGSANMAEFFVKTAIAATFFSAIGFNMSGVVIGLLIGGMIAAPLGAYVIKVVRQEYLMGGVGCLIIILSMTQLYMALS